MLSTGTLTACDADCDADRPLMQVWEYLCEHVWGIARDETKYLREYRWGAGYDELGQLRDGSDGKTIQAEVCGHSFTVRGSMSSVGGGSMKRRSRKTFIAHSAITEPCESHE